MSKQISRRDFLKLAGVGVATTAVLTGCGPESRYVTREPYTKMPEYTYNGLSTFYATTCRECSAGCGLVVRTMQGRALKVEGNSNNPVNQGKTCARGQATLHGVYNPDRVTDPIHRPTRGSEGADKMDWNAAIQVVADALSKNKPGEIAFLMGMAPDHLFDLVTDLTKSIGAPAPVRFGALGMFEARTTLMKAAEDALGQSGMPFFDIGGTDLIISFGANFLETWLSPVAQTREFSKMRRGNQTKRGYLVQFESRMSQTGAKADEWIPLTPGTEAMVALAIGRLVAEAGGSTVPSVFANVDVNAVVTASGVTLDTLNHIVGLFSTYQYSLIIPGGATLGLSNGLQAAEAVLALNALLGNVGKDGGVFLSPVNPLADDYHRPASGKEMQDFIKSMSDGKVKVLFVHGVNPMFELPKNLGFGDARQNVPQIISFATFADETALEADYVFPDHHGLESWGYQKVATGSASSVLSGAQPVIVPFFNTKSTVDVLLAAAQKAGGALASAFPFKDEVAFLDSKIASLLNTQGGFFSAPEINTFAASFQQYGGWWKTTDNRIVPSSTSALNLSLKADAAQFDGQGDFFFVPFVSPILGEAGANKPWLQEVPDPTTTVMWNTWVEINPDTAAKLGIDNDDVVKVVSDYGEVEVSVYKYPAIRPDTIAMPFGQGHTAYGQFAKGRGVNPADLFGPSVNEAGDLAFAGLKVRVEKTGKKRQLSRLEGTLGVYGFGGK